MNRDGFIRDGWARDGWTCDGFARDEWTCDGLTRGGYGFVNRDGFSRDGWATLLVISGRLTAPPASEIDRQMASCVFVPLEKKLKKYGGNSDSWPPPPNARQRQCRLPVISTI